MKRFLTTLTVVLTTAFGLGEARAQQPFAAAATVNGQAVTNFQVTQRSQFFTLLRAPDSDLNGARETMINETLQVQAARAAGVEITPEQLDMGMLEFAGRANLTPDAFIAALEQNGVAPETFRDFVRNGIYWRTLIQQRFGPRARPSESEVERALARGDGGGARVRVLMSEIALPITPETEAEVSALAQRLSDTIVGQAAFEQAARNFSRSRSGPSGGRLDFIPLSELSPQIASQVLTLAPGEVSDPVNLGSFIGLFLLRDLDESAATTPETLSIDYAEYLIPGGRTAQSLGAAQQLRDRVDVCDDLYRVAQSAPEGTLTRTTAPANEIAADVRQELAKLDDGEVSTLLTRGGFLRFIMMCGRVAEPSEEALQALGQQILNDRLGSLAESFLDELRADAIITQ